MKNKYQSQKGQVLLSFVLIATVLVTIGLTVLQTSRKETTNTKREEDQKKALAAAEAGIDAAIKLSPGENIQIGDLNLDETVSGTATVDDTVTPSFTTQLLTKDKQQTFYLGNYDSTTNDFTTTIGPSETFTIDIVTPLVDYCTTDNQFGLELTFLHKDDGVVGRKIIDKCDPPTITGTEDKLIFDDQDTVTVTPPANSHLLLIRVIALSDNFAGTRLQLNKTAGNWPFQGKTIISTAQTNTGVSKKIRFFQSYPQIPTELFVTSF